MNDLKEIAREMVKGWPCVLEGLEDDIAAALQAERDARSCARNQRSTQFCAEAVAVHAELERVKTALQAEREDGCRRVNDAIGDRDPIIEKLKAELERVTKQRDEANSSLLGHALSAKMLKAELERVKAERDEAVKALEPFAAIARMFSSELPDTDELHIHTLFGHQSTYATLGHCRAARAVVEKVKPHHSLDIRNPLPYNTPDEQPQAGEAEHEAET